MSVGNASNQQLSIVGTIKISINVVSGSAIVKFNVVECLETEVILVCDFCIAYVKVIQPRM